MSGRAQPPRVTGAGLRLSTVWAAVAFSLPATIVLGGQLGSVDLGYVVRAGQIMLDTGHLLRTDVFLFTTRCDPWLNQQWGAELVLAGVYQGLGWLGLALVRAVLTTGVMGLVFAACRAHGAERRAAAWLTLLAAVLLMSGLQLRAQLFGLLFFAAVLWLVARRHERPNALFWAVPLLALWANTHGSFPFGILVLLVAWAEDLVTSRPGRRTLVTALLSIGATAVTPFGASVWGYVVDLSTNPVIREVVQEWRPPSATTYVGAVFFASIPLAIVVMVRNRRAVPWPVLIQLGVFLVLAASSTRAVAWWGLVMPVTLARLPWAHTPPRLDLRNRANAVLASALIAIPVFAVVRWVPYTDDAPPPGRVAFAPAGITSELRTILEPGEPFANPQAWGSWFELSLPGHPIFVDSRFELMPVETLRANHRIANAEPGWERDLDALPVRVLVVDEQDTELAAALGSHPVWRGVYADADGFIFVREDRPPAGPMPACRETGG